MARILLVDDEKLARTMYGDSLAQAGHRVVSVKSYIEAVAALKNEPFEVVVTDLILPTGNGMELLSYIKEAHPGTEIIVITALDKVDPAVRAIKSGAAEYLVKPVAPDVLVHAVSRALTTRVLLRENADLRRHVALLENAQRVATTLDREKLRHVSVSAFSQVTSAAAGWLATKSATGEIQMEASWGLDEAFLGAVAPLLKPWCANGPLAEGVPDGKGAVPNWVQPAWPFQHVYVQPAVEGRDILGYAALFFPTSMSHADKEAALFLGRYWGMALRNLGKFAEVEDLAYLDGLTQLYNSRYLELALEREAQSAQNSLKPFSLLFLDLDFFKTVNDTHGHAVGSQLLIEVAKILKKCVRDNDIVCRWGGDEYVILLRGTDSGGALKVAERIRRSVEAHQFMAREGLSLSITTCIGVASYPEHAHDTQTLFEFADRAMYRGKKGTRNIIYLASKDLADESESRQVSLEKH